MAVTLLASEFDDFGDDFEVREQALKELQGRIRSTPHDLREALAKFEPEHDGDQGEVIVSTGQTVRLVAPAGSGKTQTAINRILHQVKSGTNPTRVLVLTFDNAAVTGLRNNLASQTGNLAVSIKGLLISTLNAFGYGMLRTYAPDEHKPVLEEWRRRRILRGLLQKLRGTSKERFDALPTNVEQRFYLDFFSLLKNQLWDPRSFETQQFADFVIDLPQAKPFFAAPPDEALFKKVVQAIMWLFRWFEVEQQNAGGMDFDDQKLRAFVALRDSAELREMIQESYDEVIVDEFQDINKLDFEFIKLLAARARLVVIGDDDQAIYGFRGCTPDFIINLDQHLGRDFVSYELRTNYRCPPNIVACADRLIRHNTPRIEKSPVAASTQPADIKLLSSLSAGLEAKSVVALIQEIRRQQSRLTYSDFVVLYRTNAQSLPLQLELLLTGLPYYVRDEDNILANQSLERLLAVLRLKLALRDGKAPAAGDAMLTTRAYFRFLNEREVASLETLFDQLDFLAAINSGRFSTALPKSEGSRFLAAVQEVREAPTLMDVLDVLGKRFKGLAGMIGSLEDVIDEKVPLGEIYDVALGFNGVIEDFLSTLEHALSRGRQMGAGKDQEGGIGLRTYFRSKGLQWHTVILTTCNEGLIPHYKAPLEDERRLFYVAMTRASANLILSYVNNACNNKVSPSRFLKEAGLLESA